jgi:hypothetical protein
MSLWHNKSLCLNRRVNFIFEKQSSQLALVNMADTNTDMIVYIAIQ